MDYLVWYRNGCISFYKKVRCIKFEKNGFMRMCIDCTGERDEFVNSADVVRIQAVGGVISDDN